MATEEPRIAPTGSKQEALDRFGLSRGQHWTRRRYKNLWWDLSGNHIGYGDLSDADIRKIQRNLKADEEFVGWHESHGTARAVTTTPMIRITKTTVLHREDIIDKEGM